MLWKINIFPYYIYISIFLFCELPLELLLFMIHFVLLFILKTSQ